MQVSGKKPVVKPSSTFSHASEEDLKLFCTPCDRVGPRLPAFGFCATCKEHLCQSCFDHHKVATPSRNHVLLNKDSMPTTQEQTSIFDKKENSSSDLTKPCLRHKNKTIEYYCLNHKKLLCNVCVTLEHNPSSCNVKFIPEISEEVIDSQELKSIIKQMDTIMQDCQTIKKTSKHLTTESNNSLDKAFKDIKTWRMELNKRLDEMEKTVKDRAKYLHQQNEKRLHNTETICQDVGKSVNALKDNIQQTNTAKQADKLFIEIKTAQQELCEYRACIRDLKEVEDVYTYQFKPNTSIINPFTRQKTLGDLESTKLNTDVEVKQPRQLNVPLTKADTKIQIQKQSKVFIKKQPMTPKVVFPTKDIPYSGDLCVRAISDTYRCCITGIAWLNDHHMVVADNNNRSVKIIQTKEKKVRSVMDLPSKPWDVTIIPRNQLAVTLPYDKMILFLTTKSNMLSKAHALTVNGQCTGISYCNNKLVVTYTDPIKCEILNMKGTVLTKISGKVDSRYTIMDPSYVQTTDQTIYISDCGAKTITKLNWQGGVVDILNDKGEFKGIAVADDGKVYICEQGSDSSVSQVTADLQQRNRLTTQTRRPQAICCWSDGSLYISNHSYMDVDNFLSIYKIAGSLV